MSHRLVRKKNNDLIFSYEIFELSIIFLNFKNLYNEELKLENTNNHLNLTNLETFLADNVFRIEKLTGKFIKNISLIVEDNKISNINFSIKKKN